MVSTNHVTADRNINWRARSREAYYGFGRAYARISWGAIFAGAVVALAVQLVLTLIGGAIGLATLSPATGQSPSGTALGLGAAIWLVISSLISLFVAGYVAGATRRHIQRLATRPGYLGYPHDANSSAISDSRWGTCG